MNHIFVLKEEKTETIRKFNKIKKWFISNFYSNIEDKILYVYENKINISAPYFLNFYMIAPNVFPMLNSCLLENALKQKNSICEDHINTIINLQLKNPIKIENENENTIINFTQLYNIFTKLPTHTYGIIQEYHIKKIP